MTPEENSALPPRRRPSSRRSPLALLSVPVVALGVVAMLVSCTGVKSPSKTELQQRIEELEQENLSLQAEVEELNEKSVNLSKRVFDLLSQQKLSGEDVALIRTQLDIIDRYANELPEEAAEALNNIIEFLNSK